MPSNAIAFSASVADAVLVPITVNVTVTVAVTNTITIAITVTIPVAVAVTLAFASAVTIATAAANVFTAVVVACQCCCHHCNKCRAVTFASSVATYIALLLFLSTPLPSIPVVAIINNAIALAFRRCFGHRRSCSHCCCHSC
jgi:hypothetical protein